MDDGG